MTTANSKHKSSKAAAAPAATAFGSLVVAVDLTPGADRVLGRLSLLPLADGARVTLLHVVPSGPPTSEQRRAVRDADKVLAGEVRYLRKHVHKNVRIHAEVRLGTPAKQIAATAADVKAELIVMGRGGGRLLRDAFLGSTAERVIRQARLPVLAVRLAPRSAYTRPALALDLEPNAVQVVRLLLRAVPPPRPRVEVIHAFDIPYRNLVYPSLSEDEAEERKDELRSKASRELARLLASALAKANVPPADRPFWKTHVQCGPPRLVVEKALKKAETDLLVLGTRAHSGPAYVFLGTVAGDLLRSTKCDVLVVPPRA